VPLPAVEVSTEQCTPTGAGFEGWTEEDFALTTSQLTFFKLPLLVKSLYTSVKDYCLWFMVLLVLFFGDFSAKKERLCSVRNNEEE
jgi:hypothetical protein